MVFGEGAKVTLREYLKNRAIKQKELAALSGVNSSTIAALCCRMRPGEKRRAVGIAPMEKIAVALGITLDALAGMVPDLNCPRYESMQAVRRHEDELARRVADAQAALVVQASAVEVEEPEEAPSVAELVQRARSLMSGGAKNG